MEESFFGGFKNRLLQMLARSAPGATTWRVKLHRWRGVHIGEDVWIGYDAVIETSRPDLVTIGDRSTVQMRATIIAHFREQKRRGDRRGRYDRSRSDHFAKRDYWPRRDSHCGKRGNEIRSARDDGSRESSAADRDSEDSSSAGRVAEGVHERTEGDPMNLFRSGNV